MTSINGEECHLGLLNFWVPAPLRGGWYKQPHDLKAITCLNSTLTGARTGARVRPWTAGIKVCFVLLVSLGYVPRALIICNKGVHKLDQRSFEDPKDPEETAFDFGPVGITCRRVL